MKNKLTLLVLLLIFNSVVWASEFTDACRDRNLEVVKKYIAAHEDLNAKSEDSVPALVVAALNGHTEVVRLLLENGAHVDDRISGSWLGYLNSVRNSKKQDALVINWIPNMAISSENLPRLIQDQDEELNALMVASYLGYEDIVTLLLQYKADVNAKSTKGWTPLMFAATMGNTEIIKKLLKAGAGLDNRDVKLQTALVDSVLAGNYKSFRVLLNYQASTDDKLLSQSKHSPLQIAAHFGRLQMVKDLVDAGAAIDFTGLSIKPAFTFAVEEGYYEVAKYLLDKGSDFNTNGLTGPSPLKIARTKGYVKIEKMLVGKNASE